MKTSGAHCTVHKAAMIETFYILYGCKLFWLNLPVDIFSRKKKRPSANVNKVAATDGGTTACRAALVAGVTSTLPEFSSGIVPKSNDDALAHIADVFMERVFGI